MNRILRFFIPLAGGLLLTISLTLFLQSTNAVAQSTDRGQVIQTALAYLRAQQQTDGGILGFSGVSDPDTTARVVLAYLAAGQPASEAVSTEGNTMLDYLATQAISFTHDVTGTLFPGRAGLLLSAVSLAGEEPVDFGGMDLIDELEESYQPDIGAYSTTAKQDFSSGQASDLNQAWVILGLGLSGQELPEGASQYLLSTQAADGSWGFSDPDTTALAVIALLTGGQVNAQHTSIQNAIAYFHATQLASGGWRPSWDTDPLNADSTGWILQALLSAGEDPSVEDWTVEGVNPSTALMGLQKPDGSIGGTFANTYSTAEAIIGLAGTPLASMRSVPVVNQAGIAILPGDGSVITACVSFAEASVTGLDLLRSSGVEIVTATNPNQGTAVCQIENTGCSADNCFCDMPNYWSYWQLIENNWAYAPVGAEQSQVVNGDVNAWSWGSGEPPALITYQNICEGEPLVLPVATQTSLSPTDNPQPTLTALPVLSTGSPEPTAVENSAQTSLGTYIVYGLIIIVLGGVIVYLIRARRK